MFVWLFRHDNVRNDQAEGNEHRKNAHLRIFDQLPHLAFLLDLRLDNEDDDHRKHECNGAEEEVDKRTVPEIGRLGAGDLAIDGSEHPERISDHKGKYRRQNVNIGFADEAVCIELGIQNEEQEPDREGQQKIYRHSPAAAEDAGENGKDDDCAAGDEKLPELDPLGLDVVDGNPDRQAEDRDQADRGDDGADGIGAVQIDECFEHFLIPP